MIESILICAGAIGFAAWIIYGVLSLAPWLPTRAGDMERIGSVVDFQAGDVFYDLGSGDGRVLFPLAQKYPQVEFVGVEISFFLYFLSVSKKFICGTKNVRFVRGDVYKQDYSDAKVIYVFGTRRTLNGRFKEEILSQVTGETTLVLYNFSLDDWSGTSWCDAVEGGTPIYCYSRTLALCTLLCC